jgi:NAD(P)-dependent dehydrogenase (short-subunit alcohol dehydrogenase family)
VFVRADVTSAADCAAMVARAAEALGGLDCAFNNAGTEGVMKPLTELTEAEWDRVIATNLTSVWRCMKLEVPHLVARGGGAIVNCASIAGLVGFPAASAYVASKHGVIGLTKAAALELARTGVRVNAICPGVIATPMIDRATGGDPAKAALYASTEPVGRLGTPEEVAELAVYLCSSRAGFLTGAAIPIDGGWVAQ